MRSSGDLLHQYTFRPTKPEGRADIPKPLPHRQVCLQNNNVLCPAQGHRLTHNFGSACICTVKFPHPAQVPGRKSDHIRICALQILRCRNSGTFFPIITDHPAYLIVQFQLWRICSHKYIQRRKHGAIVNVFLDIHGFSPFLNNFSSLRAEENASA